MIWAIVQQLGRQIANYFIFVVLALLLNPEDFGLLGMAMVWIAFMQVFSEVGFGAALIQRQQLEPRHLSTTFFFNIGLGGLLSLIGLSLSWPAALFFNTPELQSIVAILSFTFFINAFSLTQIAIVQRKLRFRELATRDIFASICGGIIGISFAYLNWGVWSLVAQQLSTCLIATTLLWYWVKWRPDIHEFSLDSVRELWEYSSKIFSFNILKFFAQNLDRLLIGYLLGATALGIYSFAYKLVVFPAASLVGATGTYLFPKFSRMQSDIRSIQASYLFVVKAICSSVIPIMILISLLSPSLIPLLFGQKWASSVPVMQVLAIVAVLQSFIPPAGQLMKAMNHLTLLLYWTFGFTIITTLSLILGSQWGIKGISIGLLIAYSIGLPTTYFIVTKLIPLNIILAIKTLLPSIVSSLVLAVFLLWLVSVIDTVSASAKVNLSIVGGVTGIIPYILVLICLDRTFILAIWVQLMKVFVG